MPDDSNFLQGVMSPANGVLEHIRSKSCRSRPVSLWVQFNSLTGSLFDTALLLLALESADCPDRRIEHRLRAVSHSIDLVTISLLCGLFIFGVAALNVLARLPASLQSKQSELYELNRRTCMRTCRYVGVW
jgi:hypothetical protein